ncbi:hypothetical protein [Pararhodobacter sp.]|uniref:hypothetical protein n=1 Tax=Pararhodobacter sp. TaxID=2127056 RepID=UPI002FDCC380
MSEPLGHGAAALLGAHELIINRRTFRKPDATDAARHEAATWLAAYGGQADQLAAREFLRGRVDG